MVQLNIWCVVSKNTDFFFMWFQNKNYFVYSFLLILLNLRWSLKTLAVSSAKTYNMTEQAV